MTIGNIATIIGLASVALGTSWWAFEVDDHVTESEVQIAQTKEAVQSIEEYIGAQESRAEEERKHRQRVERMCKTGEIKDKEFCRKRGFETPEED